MKKIIVTEQLFQGAISFEHYGDIIKPWRIPFDKRRLFPPEEAMIINAEHSSGVRLRFQTDTGRLVLAIFPWTEPRHFDLTLDGELIRSVRVEPQQETAEFIDLPAGDKILELWLEQNAPTTIRHLLIDDDAEITAVDDTRPLWITYGSSITHCRNAHSPARTWPATVARHRNLNLTSIGLGGNCQLEPLVAMMIRDRPADVITLKLGINNLANHTPRIFKTAVLGFVTILREKHPHTPLGIISPIIFAPYEYQAFGTTGLTMAIVRRELIDAVQRLIDYGDQNLYLFDGRQLLGAEHVSHYFQPDLCHPNADGYELLGQNFLKLIPDRMPFPSGRQSNRAKPKMAVK